MLLKPCFIALEIKCFYIIVTDFVTVLRDVLCGVILSAACVDVNYCSA